MIFETTLIQICCVVGIFISLYFAAIYNGNIKGNKALVPKTVCAEKSCATVLQTKYAKMFLGIPNFIWGILFYVFVFNCTLFPKPDWILLLLFASSSIVLGSSIYLFYILIAKLKTPCPLCFVAHAINLIIFLHYMMMFV